MDKFRPILKKCDTGEIVIEYLHYPADKPDLVMLHATGFLPWMWHPIAERLEKNFNIIIPFFCDHRWAQPEEGLSWQLLSDDLYAMFRALGVRAPFIVGHSMGATVATLCSALNPLNPAAMVLIEPIYLPQIFYDQKITVEQHPLASRSIKRRNHWESSEQVRHYLKGKKLFAKWDPRMMDLYILHGMISADSGSGLMLACSPEKEASLFMGCNARDPWPLLSAIKCPVLVVEGGMSENRLYIDLKKVASMFPAGKYTEVEHAGHLVPMEQPDIVADLCIDFFKE